MRHTLALSLLLAGPAFAEDEWPEARFYAADHLTPPDGAVLEVGGMDFLPDGRLVVSTRRGQVWIVENPLVEDPTQARFNLFCEGLWEGLGLKVVDGEIYVVQRQELSRLVDEDADGVCDRIDTITSDWGLTTNYHEFAYGLPVDKRGNFYVSLNVGFWSPMWWHGKSKAPWRGWLLRISKTGKVEPWALGFRSPCGIGWGAPEELFVTDNQGDWMPASPVFHVKKGGFYGHPASLDWTEEYRSTQTLASDTIPPARAADDRKPAALWLPYKWSRSPGNLLYDDTGGRFGPFEGQALIAELTNGMVLRAGFQEVKGVMQGFVLPFRQRLGSVVRLRFAPDGTLFTGLTNRGWGGLPPANGIGRVRWTGETPMEMRWIELVSDGFKIDFTRAVAGRLEPGPENVELTQYDYDYWWEYGSPERTTTALEVTSVELNDERDSITVRANGLKAGRVARLILSGVTAEDGTPLLHDEFAYTINQLHDAPLSNEHVAKIVPPPPARESEAEGWLRLTYGDATDAWSFGGWELCSAELAQDDPTRFDVTEGNGALVNTGAAPTNYVSKYEFGDAEIHLGFQLPQGGRSGLLIQGRYELVLADTPAGSQLQVGSCGGIAPGGSWPGAVPKANAYRGPGLWHELDIEFRAPRFDQAGNKIAPARLINVLIDGVQVHSEVVLEQASPGAPNGSEPETATGPLVLRGDRGQVAFGNVQVKPLFDEVEPQLEEGWVALLEGDDLSGWQVSDGGEWELDDGTLIGGGARSHIFSPRGDYTDFEVRARVKIGDGGNSGLYFRTTYGPGWPAGYEAQINSSFADPQKSGSLYSLAPVLVQLVPPDTWFDYHVTCRDTKDGTHIVIRINDVVVTDFLDRERRHDQGHIAIQQHHEGSVVEIRELAVREF